MGPEDLESQFAVAVELDELAGRRRPGASVRRRVGSLHRVDDPRGRVGGPQAACPSARAWPPSSSRARSTGTPDSSPPSSRSTTDVSTTQRALIEETLAVGRQAQTWDADIAHLFAQFILRREQDRLAELEDDLRRGLTSHPGYRSLRCMLLTCSSTVAGLGRGPRPVRPARRQQLRRLPEGQRVAVRPEPPRRIHRVTRRSRHGPKTCTPSCRRMQPGRAGRPRR